MWIILNTVIKEYYTGEFRKSEHGSKRADFTADRFRAQSFGYRGSAVVWLQHHFPGGTMREVVEYHKLSDAKPHEIIQRVSQDGKALEVRDA